MVLVNWLLKEGGRMNPDESLAFEVLSTCLVGNAAAPLSKALQDSGLGSAVIGGGFDDELLQPTFSIGLKGVDHMSDADMKAVQQTVLDILRQHADNGFDRSLLLATINTYEFSLRYD